MAVSFWLAQFYFRRVRTRLKPLTHEAPFRNSQPYNIASTIGWSRSYSRYAAMQPDGSKTSLIGWV